MDQLSKDHLESIMFIHSNRGNLNPIFEKACKDGNLTIVKLLFSLPRYEPIPLEPIEMQNIKVNMQLQDEAFNIQITNHAIEIACESGNLELVKFLIPRFEIELINFTACSILQCACIQKDMELIEWLQSVKDLNQWRFQYIILMYGNLDLIELLFNQIELSFGQSHIDPNNIFADVCQTGNLDAAQFLLDKFSYKTRLLPRQNNSNCIDINREDDLPFRMACKNNQLDIIQFLLSIEMNGIDIHTQNDEAFFEDVADFLLPFLNNNPNEFYFIENSHHYVLKPINSKFENESVPNVIHTDCGKIYYKNEEHILDCYENYLIYRQAFARKSARSRE